MLDTRPGGGGIDGWLSGGGPRPQGMTLLAKHWLWQRINDKAKGIGARMQLFGVIFVPAHTRRDPCLG